MLESHVALGEALCHVLEAAGFRTRHHAADPPAALSRLRSAAPAAVVVGLEPTAAPPTRLTLLRGLGEAGVPTVGVTGHLDDPVRRRLLRRAGADWVVGRHEPLARFVEVVSLAASGVRPEPGAGPEELTAADVERMRDIEESVERLLRLGHRERIVLAHLERGRTVEEIARIEHLAVSTVRTQSASVLRKLEVSSQLAAVALLRRAVQSVPADRGGVDGAADGCA